MSFDLVDYLQLIFKMSKVASSYRLPCVYCKDGVAFPSSDKLKEHLLGSHKNVVCGIKSNASEMFGADINKDERSGK